MLELDQALGSPLAQPGTIGYNPHMPTFFKDKTGQRYSRLVVLGISGRTAAGAVVYKCLCDCGKEKLAVSGSLTTGYVRSCGCLRADRSTKHGHARRNADRSPEYRIWEGMIARCENPRAAGYANYGGRGISVCERWSDYNSFLADMGPKPTPNHSIERIDNDLGYFPGNCRWATNIEQRRNKRNTIRVMVDGVTVSLAEACALMNVPYNTARHRHKKGYSPFEKFRRHHVAAP